MPHVPKPAARAAPPEGVEKAIADHSTSESGVDAKTQNSNASPIHLVSDPASESIDQASSSLDSTSLLSRPDQADAAPVHHEFSMRDFADADLIAELRKIEVTDDEKLPRVEVTGGDGQHVAFMRIDHPLKLRVRGCLGDYAFAMNSQTIAKVFGDVGNGVAEGMVSGSVRIRGNAADGAGTALVGGTLGIYGTAGHRVGAALRGGGIFVRGNVGDDLGLGAVRGTIVVGGSAGRNVGDPHSDVAIYVRGKVAGLTEGMIETSLRKKQEVQLGLLLISAGIRGDAKDFRRIVPKAKLDAENASRGEVAPNWR
ncbi:MAG: tributyrin esterase [Planctomycetota bacterium]